MRKSDIKPDATSSRRVFVATIRLAMVVIALLCSRRDEVLDADQLMRHALAAEGVVATEAGPPAGVPPALARTLGTVGFDWRRPLSASALHAFRRAHLADKVESVRREHAGEELLVLTTSVPEGEVRRIELTVDAEMYRVRREVMVFADGGRLEVDAATGGTMASYVLPNRPPVRFEWHRRLGGVPVGGGAEQELHRLLDLAERLTLDMLRGAAHASPGAGLGPGRDMVRFGLRDWRKRTFSNRTVRETFLPELVQSLDATAGQLAILVDLAARYPDPRHRLSPDARMLFQRLVDLHYRRLRAELNASRERMATLAGTVPGVHETDSTPPGLLGRAPLALTRARTLEQLVLQALRRNDLTDADRERLSNACAALWEAVYGPMPARH